MPERYRVFRTLPKGPSRPGVNTSLVARNTITTFPTPPDLVQRPVQYTEHKKAVNQTNFRDAIFTLGP